MSDADGVPLSNPFPLGSDLWGRGRGREEERKAVNPEVTDDSMETVSSRHSGMIHIRILRDYGSMHRAFTGSSQTGHLIE